MSDSLASRIAGLKLGGIVAILLLPMLVLSLLMLSSLRRDIAFTQNELRGVAFSRVIMGIAMSSAAGNVSDDEIASFRAIAPPLADDLGLRPQLETALAALMTYTSDRRFAVDALVKLQMEVATASSIILDPFAETYFLGAISTKDGPLALTNYTRLQTLTSRAVRDGTVDHEEATRLLIASGAWGETQNVVLQMLKSARNASAEDEDFERAIARAIELSDHAVTIGRLIAKGSGEHLAVQLVQSVEVGTGSEHLLSDMKAFWSYSVDRLDGLLQARLGSMQLRLYSLLAIAAAACLIGVGGAALMFRSTLRRLDDVKLARDEADAARREAEAAASELQRVNDDVIQLNADLSRSLKLLRETQDENLKKGKMAQLGQLTATVAHELRNPLGAVRTSTFLLERKLKDKNLGVESQLERINNGVTRCDNIISQLLDFARTKALSLESVAFDDWLAGLVQEEAEKLPATVSIECALGLGALKASIDPARMTRVFINLLGNASEAMVGKGDDPSKFATRQPVITVSTQLTRRGIEVSVRDNGPGIPLENQERIFEPLFTTKNFGTGLGLPAVQKILEQHGGSIELHSILGQGATFTAWFPTNLQVSEAA